MMNSEKFNLVWNEFERHASLTVKDLFTQGNFIYLGHTEVRQEDLNSFMETAKELEIKGLVDDAWKLNNESKADLLGNRYNKEIEDLSVGDKVSQQGSVMDDLSSKESDYESSSEILIHLDTPSMKDENGKYPCDECEYQAGKSIEIKRHKLAKHKGLKFSCNFCQQGFSFKSNLIRHQKKIHPGIF